MDATGTKANRKKGGRAAREAEPMDPAVTATRGKVSAKPTPRRLPRSLRNRSVRLRRPVPPRVLRRQAAQQRPPSRPAKRPRRPARRSNQRRRLQKRPLLAKPPPHQRPLPRPMPMSPRQRPTVPRRKRHGLKHPRTSRPNLTSPDLKPRRPHRRWKALNSRCHCPSMSRS